jgi:hypothetical protein
MYCSYVESEYVAMSFSPARTDLALKLLKFCLLLSFGSFGAPFTSGLIMSIKQATYAGPIAVNGALISKN